MIEVNVKPLDYTIAFNQLSEKEKLYAYYLNKAVWAGIPISFFQISYESPALFIIFQSFFTSFDDKKDMEIKVFTNQNISKLDFYYFLLYVSHFYTYYGNYSSFGRSKVYPYLPMNKFEEILKQSPKFESFSSIWDKIKFLIYKHQNALPKLSSKYTDNTIVGTYYLNGITVDEINKIDKILTSENILLLNTRLQKIEENKYEVLIGSIEEREKVIEKDGITLTLKYGDFKDYLIKMNSYLEKAKIYASNDLEKKIIDLYIKHFQTGDLEIHKESQRLWVKDISPVVEYNLGWIETYVDTQGVRAYYEGIVTLQNKDESTKLGKLVDKADYFISQLPWDKNFENEKFKKPDFASLDIVGFPTTLLFDGINLPNYLDIHDKEGFKNLILANAVDKYDEQFLANIIKQEDVNIFQKYDFNVNMFNICLHELYGHGSGKLFYIDKLGKFNFDIENTINPLTNEKIKKYYNPGETYESKFSTIARIMEEGRADYIALYLSYDKIAQKIFGFGESEYEDVIYCMFFCNILGGVAGVGHFKNGAWANPYAQERFILVNYILKNQTEGKEILKFEVNEQDRSFKILLNKENLLNYGKNIISEMIKLLHISKCTGDFETANNFLEVYGMVSEYMRDIYSMIPYSRKIKKRMNIELELEEKSNNVIMKMYPLHIIGFIQSLVDRFKCDYNEITFKQWTKYFNPFKEEIKE